MSFKRMSIPQSQVSRNLLRLALIALASGFISAGATTIGPVQLTPWRMHMGYNVKLDSNDHWQFDLYDDVYPTACPKEHGHPCVYSIADIPASSDSQWVDAPSPSTIGMVRESQICYATSECFQFVDFTYFEAFLSVPAGCQVEEFTIDFSDMDDGAQVLINGVAASHLTATSQGSTVDLLHHVRSGHNNRIVITQVDDCCERNNLAKAVVNLRSTCGTSTCSSEPDICDNDLYQKAPHFDNLVCPGGECATEICCAPAGSIPSTPTATPSASSSNSPIPTHSATPTSSGSPLPSHSVTPIVSMSTSPSHSASMTMTPPPTSSPSISPSVSKSASPSQSASMSMTPSPTSSHYRTPPQPTETTEETMQWPERISSSPSEPTKSKELPVPVDQTTNTTAFGQMNCAQRLIVDPGLCVKHGEVNPDALETMCGHKCDVRCCRRKPKTKLTQHSVVPTTSLSGYDTPTASHYQTPPIPTETTEKPMLVPPRNNAMTSSSISATDTLSHYPSPSMYPTPELTQHSVAQMTSLSGYDTPTASHYQTPPIPTETTEKPMLVPPRNNAMTSSSISATDTLSHYPSPSMYPTPMTTEHLDSQNSETPHHQNTNTPRATTDHITPTSESTNSTRHPTSTAESSTSTGHSTSTASITPTAESTTATRYSTFSASETQHAYVAVSTSTVRHHTPTSVGTTSTTYPSSTAESTTSTIHSTSTAGITPTAKSATTTRYSTPTASETHHASTGVSTSTVKYHASTLEGTASTRDPTSTAESSTSTGHSTSTAGITPTAKSTTATRYSTFSASETQHAYVAVSTSTVRHHTPPSVGTTGTTYLTSTAESTTSMRPPARHQAATAESTNSARHHTTTAENTPTHTSRGRYHCGDIEYYKCASYKEDLRCCEHSGQCSGWGNCKCASTSCCKEVIPNARNNDRVITDGSDENNKYCGAVPNAKCIHYKTNRKCCASGTGKCGDWAVEKCSSSYCCDGTRKASNSDCRRGSRLRRCSGRR